MAEFKNTADDAQDLLHDAEDIVYGPGGSKFPGMSYEDGVSATLKWLLDGYDDEHPLSE